MKRLSNARTKVALSMDEVSRPRGDAPQGLSPRGLETSFIDKATLVRDAVAQTTFQMAEPRRTVY